MLQGIISGSVDCSREALQAVFSNGSSPVIKFAFTNLFNIIAAVAIDSGITTGALSIPSSQPPIVHSPKFFDKNNRRIVRPVSVEVCGIIAQRFSTIQKTQILHPAAILLITFIHKYLYNPKAFLGRCIAAKTFGKFGPMRISVLWITC